MSANWDFSVLWSTAWIGNTGWKSKVVCYATTSEDIKEHQCVKGGCNEDTARIFSVVPSDRTGSDGFKLKHRRFPLDSKKHFFYCEGDQHKLSREAVESLSLEIFKSHLHTVLSSLQVGGSI